MGNGFISFLFAVGIAAWIYAKVQHRTLNSQTAAIVAGVIGFILFLVIWSLLGIVF